MVSLLCASNSLFFRSVPAVIFFIEFLNNYSMISVQVL